MSPIAVPSSYEELRAVAIDARDAAIPPEYRLPKTLYPLPKNVSGVLESSQILDDTELKIVDLTATQLRDAIAQRRYTAVQVAKAYCKAAAVAQQVTNCTTDLFQAEALKRASWLDAEMERTGKVVGPLHGVPVSIKVSHEGHLSPPARLIPRTTSMSKDMTVLRVSSRSAAD
jgi:amidase